MFRASLLLLGSLASASVACGGVVVFDDGGGEGASGPGSSSAGPGSGPGTGSTGSGPGTTCDYFCSRVGPCLGQDDCGELCRTVYVPGCEAEADALLRCVADRIQPNTCEFYGGCEREEATYSSCQVGGGCDDSSCYGGPGECGCTAFCPGYTLSDACRSVPNGTSCDCYIDETYVGTCGQASLSCGVGASCCEPLWFGVDDAPVPPG